MLSLVLPLLLALSQRPSPGSEAATCATGGEGDQLLLACSPGGKITSVTFADYGEFSGSCGARPSFSPGSCGVNVSAALAKACVGQGNCSASCTHGAKRTPVCCTGGVGSCCGCKFSSGGGGSFFVNLTDPCPGKAKSQAFAVRCDNEPDPGHDTSVVVQSLKVNSLESPITIDDESPHFSWVLSSANRGIVATGYELEVRDRLTGAVLLSTGKVSSNLTAYITGGGHLSLPSSDAVYDWGVRAFTLSSSISGAGSDTATAWANASFQTALLQQGDWANSAWIAAPGGDSPGQFASQMRKVFTLPAGTISRATCFVALPGYGQVFVNGHQVDDPETGTRSLSQYDVRMLYHTYDVSEHLLPGVENVIAVYVGLGWFGHPAVPPQAQRFPFGPPTVRMLLRAHIQTSGFGTGGANITEIGTDGSWFQTQGPVIYDDEYNGQTYDARLETPGWTEEVEGFTAPPWSPVHLCGAKPFALAETVFSSAAFQPIKVLTRRAAESMWSPAPGVYVYDFSQNEPGWCKLGITGQRGLAVQLRHAEILQHPPHGPADGSIYNGNLRSAKATDIYVLSGDPAGESIEFSFTQHGFRYVELTFIGAAAGGQPPPTLETLTAINVRSSVELAGDLTFSDPMLQQVHHNILWGQASNLMMVPSDCDNRDERFGWTGDSALTADEAANNFDLSSFYDNWARMLDDSSQNGAVACWVPGGVGHSSPAAGKSCDASWGSAFPSTVYALFKWSGDVITPRKRWPGLTRFIDNEYSRTATAGNTIRNIFTGPGDWCPPPRTSADNTSFVGEARTAPPFTSGFSFINDVTHMVEMAAGLGLTADAAKYGAMLSKIRAEYHAAWYNQTAGWYVNGEQTAQVLALELDIPPTPEIKAKVLAQLVKNIVQDHDNHTTSGIIGWRYVPGVLSRNGLGDLAYALMTQTTYPSIGYEALNIAEPATTLWELWDSDVEGDNMNSRNHIMFGGNGVWLHTYVGGIDNLAGAVGFGHAVIAPPQALVVQAAGAVCGNSTGTRRGSSSPPLEWTSATKHTLKGTFSLFWKVACVAAGTTVLTAEVAVPANALGTTVLPLLTGSAVTATISESGAAIWAHGGYVAGVPGITGATANAAAGTIEIRHGSGEYAFEHASV